MAYSVNCVFYLGGVEGGVKKCEKYYLFYSGVKYSITFTTMGPY
jgi:hypothetical protein